MSASNLLSQEKPATDRKAYEPSMEEILASIRRIIADDQALAENLTPPPEAAKTAPPESEAERVITRPTPVEAVVPSPAPMPAPPAAAGPNETVFVPPQRRAAVAPDVAKTPEPLPPPKAATADTSWPHGTTQPQAAPPPPRPAVRQEWPRSAANMQAPAEVAKVPPEPEPERAEIPRPRPPEPAHEEPLVSPATDHTVSGAFNALVASRFVPTSEAMTDLVREMIRPMLKAWLDDNLPIMVERLVRTEIERVARGGR
jgi:uncharacterized protein